jgi:hypothetical protein
MLLRINIWGSYTYKKKNRLIKLSPRGNISNSEFRCCDWTDIKIPEKSQKSRQRLTAVVLTLASSQLEIYCRLLSWPYSISPCFNKRSTWKEWSWLGHTCPYVKEARRTCRRQTSRTILTLHRWNKITEKQIMIRPPPPPTAPRAMWIYLVIKPHTTNGGQT